MNTSRSKSCPISTTLDIIGDKWTLLIFREIIFLNKTTYNEILESVEGIATNILANRLKFLEENRLLIKKASPNNKLKKNYFLTNKAIGLLPIIFEVVIWGTNNLDPENGNKLFKQILKSKTSTLKKYEILLKNRLNDALKNEASE